MVTESDFPAPISQHQPTPGLSAPRVLAAGTGGVGEGSSKLPARPLLIGRGASGMHRGGLEKTQLRAGVGRGGGPLQEQTASPARLAARSQAAPKTLRRRADIS